MKTKGIQDMVDKITDGVLYWMFPWSMHDKELREFKALERKCGYSTKREYAREYARLLVELEILGREEHEKHLKEIEGIDKQVNEIIHNYLYS